MYLRTLKTTRYRQGKHRNRVARPNLWIVITFGSFSISNSKIWGKPFRGKLAVRDKSVFLHYSSKHVPIKTVVPLFSNWFPNSTQLKLTSQQAPRLDSTGAVKHTRYEFNGKSKASH